MEMLAMRWLPHRKELSKKQRIIFAGLAQLEERFTCNEDVRGSIPLTGTKHCSYSSVIEYVLCTDETTV